MRTKDEETAKKFIEYIVEGGEMTYPVRCQIIDPIGATVNIGRVDLQNKAPPKSIPHIGKKGLAERVRDDVKITLDDGNIIYGYECWWIPIEEEK